MGPRCFFERARRSHIFRPELFCRSPMAHIAGRCGPTAPDGRLPIDANLKIKGMPVEFAAGDVAWLPIDGTHASVMSCQHARPMGRFAGYNVVGDLLSRPMLPPGNWPDNQRDIGTVDHQSLNLPIEGLRTPGGAIAGVRTRRIVALVFDLVLVSILSFALWLALAVLTFGLSLFILPPLFPIVAFFLQTPHSFRL
jgi:NADH dehydrogenase FAD-containing subunit